MMAPATSSLACTLGLPHGEALIVGLGQTGLSVARFLAKNGWSLSIVDAREDAPSLAELSKIDPDAKCYIGQTEFRYVGDSTGSSMAVNALMDRSQLVVASPGVAPSHALLQAAREQGIPVVGDIEIFARTHKETERLAPVAAITGTNGKSTVTAWLGDMARRDGIQVAVGGNIGTPALELLEDAEAELFVLELSSFQLDTTESLSLRVATVLNVAEDHLDRYADIGAYANSKARIFKQTATAVMNADDPYVMAMPITAKQVLFSLQTETDYCLRTEQGEEWLVAQGERVLALREMRLLGRHNAANALAAIAMADELGISRGAIAESLREFAGLAHRMEWIADYAGVRYINDSKGTNVGATLAAVAGLSGGLILIAGGDGKGQDFSPLVEALRGKVKQVVLLGRDAQKIANALGDTVPWQCVADMAAAVCAASAAATAGDTVLLSPACSSLDMFRNYLHRGDMFRQCVEERAG